LSDSTKPPSIEEWKTARVPRTLSAEQFSILPDGEVYNEYGLEDITIHDFAKGKAHFTVEVFRMAFKSGAYGLYTFNRASLAANRKEFLHGRYLISISSSTPISDLDESLISYIRQTLVDKDSGQMPSLPLHLPEQNKIVGSEVYVVGPLALGREKNFAELKDGVVFTGGAEAVTATYSNGGGTMNLIIIEYHTPQLLIDGYAKIQQYFDGLPQIEKDRRSLTRIGNYIVHASNIIDRESARQIIGQIKYTPSIYWEGRKQSDIPLEYRPADPAAIEEALETANVLIRTFYWIGVMITSAIFLGIIAGSSIFYWKRYRRRKLGVDDLFSDAGGTVRLNLDEYLLTSPQENIKRIGSSTDQD
jgi:hypothetical protein